MLVEKPGNPSGARLVWPEQEGGHRSQGERRWEVAIWPLSEAGAKQESNGKRHDLQRVATTPRVQIDVSYCVLIVLLYGIYIYYVKQTVYIDVAGMIRIILNVFLVFDSL